MRQPSRSSGWYLVRNRWVRTKPRLPRAQTALTKISRKALMTSITLLLLAQPWCMLWRRAGGCSGSARQPPAFQVHPLVPAPLFGHHLPDQIDVRAEFLKGRRAFQVPPDLEKVGPERLLVGPVKGPLIVGGQEDVAAQQGVVGGHHLGQAEDGPGVLGRDQPAAGGAVFKPAVGLGAPIPEKPVAGSAQAGASGVF